MAETAELRMSEAVPLAHALVARLAELEDVRILFVKGPTAVALGARPPRPSTDVDVLCEPGGMERLGAALERCGWRRRVQKSSVHQLEHAAKYLFEHSVHYLHDEWPCDLDIHFNFPGFLAPDDVVFEELWRRRTTVDVANWPVPCADLLGQAAIVALHSLRDPQIAHSSRDVEFVANSLGQKGSATVEVFAQLATATGSADTLRPLFEFLGTPPVESHVDPELVRRWHVRTQNPGAHTTTWLIELRNLRWRARPALIRRALFLPADELFSARVGLARTRRNAARLQLQRWSRAARRLPRAIAAARHAEEHLP
ncbi:nucleotidyltransferase family protein [Knoellia sp. 3-2P3]|uniref:nucleotidyltransferase family protein n=1 Tax=unclassified Knoellia TaxID=2618719 RepID=UPI0023DBEBDF|nr:nucleotidyltransferase family protein [Knoellia sp. 3-2P3]MDF2094118.1 nucleotidyltransferase family protein [Knoellia sp. 3-2P3]